MVPDEWPIASPSEDDGGYPARSAGRRRLPTVRKDFFLDPRDRLTEQERALMTAMLAELLGTIADEVRGALPPGSVAANDEDSQQLLRQLTSAGLLDHADLIALLLRRADEERIANAIRARSNPRGGFLQALIADDDEALSAAAMALILARGRRRNRLGQPRIEFEDLPTPLARSLAHSVAACLRQHPRSELHDETGFFGEGDEVLGQQPAELWVLPPEQCLHAVDGAALQVDYRLVEERQLALLDGQPEG